MSDKNTKEGAPQTEEQTSDKKEVKGSETINKDLPAQISALEEREKAVSLRENAVTKKEIELKEREDKLLDNPETAKVLPGLSFKIDGEKFKFKDDAPKQILFGGKSRSQSELIKDENALIQLVSNVALIEKIS